jgi:hypothetical protein
MIMSTSHVSQYGKVTLAGDCGAQRVFSTLSRAVRSIATNDEFVVILLPG